MTVGIGVLTEEGCYLTTESCASTREGMVLSRHERKIFQAGGIAACFAGAVSYNRIIWRVLEAYAGDTALAIDDALAELREVLVESKLEQDEGSWPFHFLLTDGHKLLRISGDLLADETTGDEPLTSGAGENLVLVAYDAARECGRTPAEACKIAVQVVCNRIPASCAPPVQQVFVPRGKTRLVI